MKIQRFVINLILGLCLTSISQAKVNVVTTLPDLASIARSIGGDKVDAMSIAEGYQDPHFVDAKPSFIIKLQKADLFVQIGLELEIGWVPPLLNGARNPRIQTGAAGFVDASKGIHVLELPTGKVDRSLGDVHPFGNPHYWLDPLNGVIIAGNIADGLKRVDPANAKIYDTNLEAFKSKLHVALFGQSLVTKHGGSKLGQLALTGQLDSYLQQSKSVSELGGWLKQMEPYKGTKIITYHKSWPYFVGRFGLNVAEEIEPKPGIPSTPTHMIDLIKLIKQEKIKLIIMEPYYSRNVPDLIASKAGSKVLELPPSVGGEKGVNDYIGLFDYDINQIIAALK